MKKEKIKPIQASAEFGIHSIRIIEYALLNSDGGHIERENISYDLNLSVGIAPEQKLIFFTILAEIHHKETKYKYGNISAAVGFEIMNFNEIIKKSNNEHIVPNGLILNLSTVAISTFRGIVYATFKGTYLQDQYMPIIDPNSFFKFDLTEEKKQ